MRLLSAMLHAELQTPQPNLPPLPQGEVHAPTMMSAIGVIAGYASQCAAAASILRPPPARAPRDLVKLQCKDGSALYLGNAIDSHLLLKPNGPPALSGFLAAGLIALNNDAPDLPDAAEILRHTNEASCTPEFDVVRAPPEHAPLWSINQLLKAIWPKARVVLEHRLDQPKISKPIEMQHWPILAGIVAQQYLGFAKDIIPPRIAMSIVLESALKASRRRLIGAYASALATNEDTLFKPVPR
jgi:hypothetical protein